MEFVKDIPENNELSNNKSLEQISVIENNEIIIDVRESQKIEKNNILKNLNIDSEILQIPFYQINSTFPKLDQNREYAFFCDK
jgi:rhodanese-related sulfurtransferase